MIKFFRKIRQNLLIANKTSQYFKYAIGEIILVVIGILIALQINSWKSQREEQQLEIKIIKELKSNLKLDLVEIQEDIGIMEDINAASAYIKHYLQTNEQPSDQLSEKIILLRVTPHFDPNKSGYGLLVSKGIGIISNDSLRNDISLLYERLYSYYKRYEEERLRFHAMHSEPKLLEYFEMEFNIDVGKYYGKFDVSNEDYYKLKNDENFFRLMSAITYENSGVLDRAKRVESKILSLIDALDKELKTKKV